MNPVALDIKDLLEGESALGLSLGDNLFISVEPDQPDNTVTIYDTASPQPDSTFDKLFYHRDMIQVRIRDNAYTDGFGRSMAIYEYLREICNTEINGSYITNITCTQPPHQLKWDEQDRIIIIINFEVQRR